MKNMIYNDRTNVLKLLLALIIIIFICFLASLMIYLKLSDEVISPNIFITLIVGLGGSCIGGIISLISVTLTTNQSERLHSNDVEQSLLPFIDLMIKRMDYIIFDDKYPEKKDIPLDIIVLEEDGSIISHTSRNTENYTIVYAERRGKYELFEIKMHNIGNNTAVNHNLYVNGLKSPVSIPHLEKGGTFIFYFYVHNLHVKDRIPLISKYYNLSEEQYTQKTICMWEKGTDNIWTNKCTRTSSPKWISRPLSVS